MSINKLQVALLVFALLVPSVAAQPRPARSRTYTETRRLLAKMERSPANVALKELFQTGDVRAEDLIAALDDETHISVNSQVVIKYLADPETLHQLEQWYQRQQQLGKDYSRPIMELLSEPKDLTGNDSDLSKLAMKNRELFQAAHFNSGDISVKVVAYNETLKVALLEVVQGQILTAGWHSVIKMVNNRWRLMSDNNVWVT